MCSLWLKFFCGLTSAIQYGYRLSRQSDKRDGLRPLKGVFTSIDSLCSLWLKFFCGLTSAIQYGYRLSRQSDKRDGLRPLKGVFTSIDSLCSLWLKFFCGLTSAIQYGYRLRRRLSAGHWTRRRLWAPHSQTQATNGSGYNTSRAAARIGSPAIGGAVCVKR